MIKKYLYIILSFLAAGCIIQEKVYVSNVKDLGSLEGNSAVYALPKTVLYITVKATKTSVIPGPFQKYADKYLGIKNVPDSSTKEWTLSNINIDSYNEADPEYFFSVKTESVKNPVQILSQLAEDSLILFPPDKLFRKHVFFEQNHKTESNIHFTDLSVKRNIDIKFDTTYREVFRDSVYIKVPVLNKKLVNKSLKDKAEEAANFIIKIRKRRFKLISGQYDYMPDGDALAIAVEELDRLENEYLALFTGRKLVENYIKTIQYFPDNSRKKSKEILFRFSAEEGFVDPDEIKGRPVIIEIDDLDRGIGIQHMDNPSQAGTGENCFRIRIPDLAKVRIVYDKANITTADIPVFQFGSIIPYSLKSK